MVHISDFYSRVSDFSTMDSLKVPKKPVQLMSPFYSKSQKFVNTPSSYLSQNLNSEPSFELL